MWVGYDVPKNVNGLWGASYPGYIWKAMMEELIADKPPAKFDTSSIGGEKNPTAISQYALAHTKVITNVDNSDEKNVGVLSEYISQLENTNVSDVSGAAKIYGKALEVLNKIKDEEIKSEYTAALSEAYAKFGSSSDTDDNDEEDSVNDKNIDKTDNTTNKPQPSQTDNNENKEQDDFDEESQSDGTDTDNKTPSGNTNNSDPDKHIEVDENEQLLVPINP